MVFRSPIRAVGNVGYRAVVTESIRATLDDPYHRPFKALSADLLNDLRLLKSDCLNKSGSPVVL